MVDKDNNHYPGWEYLLTLLLLGLINLPTTLSVLNSLSWQESCRLERNSINLQYPLSQTGNGLSR